MGGAERAAWLVLALFVGGAGGEGWKMVAERVESSLIYGAKWLPRLYV